MGGLSYINFRNLDKHTRAKMRVESAAAVEKLETAEIRASGGIWIRRQDFGSLTDAPGERPSGHGQFFRFDHARVMST